MTVAMLGMLALFLASPSSALAASSAPARVPSFQPASGATATATVSIRVISGVRFGSNYIDGDRMGSLRKAQLSDSAGQLRDAELLEFQ